MRVPAPSAAGLTAPFLPPSTTISDAFAASFVRVMIDNFATAPMEGSASPRKPRVETEFRSSSGNFEVACRSTASCKSCGVMPAPSSVTRINRWPPPESTTSIRRAPASSAFSTSSFTTDAGRSTTSPAAMRLMTASESWRTGMWTTCASLAQNSSRKKGLNGAGRIIPAVHTLFSGEIFLRKHLSFFHGRLIEGIDAEKMGGDDRLQHEMHHQRAERALIQLRDMDRADRAAVLRERVGGGAALGRDEIADFSAAEIRLARTLRERTVHARTGVRDIRRENGEQLVARPRKPKLQLAVLVDRAESRDRRCALAVLAETFRPELYPPAGETLAAIVIGLQHLNVFSLGACGDGKRRAQRKRNFFRRRSRKQWRERFSRARADFLAVKTEHERGQEPDIGKRRKPPADACVVIEHHATETLEKLSQAVFLTGLCRLGKTDHVVLDTFPAPGFFQRADRGDGLHQGFAGAAGFRDRHELRSLDWQFFQHRLKRARIEIVEKMHARLPAQRAEAGYRIVRELRERLAAETRSADAEDHHVARLLQTSRGFFQRGKIVDFFRQPEKRQGAARMRRAQLFERAFRLHERRIERFIGNAAMVAAL